MIISPTSIDQDGPGIDLSNQPDGISIQMSDPVEDFEHARNAVTLTFDLAGAVNVRLGFEAMEFGDEAHAPPAAPFGEDANFDGVAVSEDGVDWYEIQGLRELLPDAFTAYDIDLDAAVAGLGLSYGSAFRIRFCQYDNDPVPKDGIFVRGIQLTGDPEGGGVAAAWSVFAGVDQGWTVSAGAPVTIVSFNARGVPFDPDVTEKYRFGVVLPGDYDGRALRYELFWCATAGTAGDVRWRVLAGCTDDGDLLGSALSGVTLLDTFTAVDTLHIVTGSAIPANETAGNFLRIEVRREGDDAADTFDTDAYLIGLRVSYS